MALGPGHWQTLPGAWQEGGFGTGAKQEANNGRAAFRKRSRMRKYAEPRCCKDKHLSVPVPNKSSARRRSLPSHTSEDLAMQLVFGVWPPTKAGRLALRRMHSLEGRTS